MKKIMFATLVAVAAVSGFIGYSKATTSSINALALANIEALSRYELPEVEIECSSTNEGSCCAEDIFHSLVMCGEYMYYPCHFTGDPMDSCYEPC